MSLCGWLFGQARHVTSAEKSSQRAGTFPCQYLQSVVGESRFANGLLCFSGSVTLRWEISIRDDAYIETNTRFALRIDGTATVLGNDNKIPRGAGEESAPRIAHAHIDLILEKRRLPCLQLPGGVHVLASLRMFPTQCGYRASVPGQLPIRQRLRVYTIRAESEASSSTHSPGAQISVREVQSLREGESWTEAARPMARPSCFWTKPTLDSPGQSVWVVRGLVVSCPVLLPRRRPLLPRGTVPLPLPSNCFCVSSSDKTRPRGQGWDARRPGACASISSAYHVASRPPSARPAPGSCAILTPHTLDASRPKRWYLPECGFDACPRLETRRQEHFARTS